MQWIYSWVRHEQPCAVAALWDSSRIGTKGSRDCAAKEVGSAEQGCSAEQLCGLEDKFAGADSGLFDGHCLAI